MERPALKRLLKDIKTGKVRIVVVYKIPWGVDSDQFWGQTGVAIPLNLETVPMPLDHHSKEPTAIRTNLWRNFRLIGTQPFNLADPVAVARMPCSGTRRPGRSTRA